MGMRKTGAPEKGKTEVLKNEDAEKKVKEAAQKAAPKEEEKEED